MCVVRDCSAKLACCLQGKRELTVLNGLCCDNRDGSANTSFYWRRSERIDGTMNVMLG